MSPGFTAAYPRTGASHRGRRPLPAPDRHLAGDRRPDPQGPGSKATALHEEKESLVELMKRARGNVALLETLQAEFERVEKGLVLATEERNGAEIRQFEAEAVVGHCLYFLEHASELWEKWPVEAKTRLQAMVFPEGHPYAVLEGKRTAKLFIIHATLADLDVSGTVAAPPRRISNPAFLDAVIECYKALHTLPEMGCALAAQKEV